MLHIRVNFVENRYLLIYSINQNHHRLNLETFAVEMRPVVVY